MVWYSTDDTQRVAPGAIGPMAVELLGTALPIRIVRYKGKERAQPKVEKPQVSNPTPCRAATPSIVLSLLEQRHLDTRAQWVFARTFRLPKLVRLYHAPRGAASFNRATRRSCRKTEA
jgi:hypothetical protein